MSEAGDQAPAPRVLRVDLVSDVVCPWCYIGWRAFQLAAASLPEIPVRVAFRPFQLDPEVPPEGVDRHARLLAKFGGDAQRLAASGAAVAEAGADVGIRFDFARIERMPNTLDAHRLLRWASGAGLGAPMAETLFRAYFCEGEDLTSRATLTGLARGIGMDGAVVRDLLATDADRDAVLADINHARTMGVTGVPCFIFDSSLAVIGAQSVEKFTRAIETAWQAAPGGASS